MALSFNLSPRTLVLCAIVALGLCTAACADIAGAEGFIGVVDGDDFNVVSGHAELQGDGIQIILSDAPGDGCNGFNTVEPIGNRKVILSTNSTDAGLYSTSGDSRISIQIKLEEEIINTRAANGTIELDFVDLGMGGEVSGTIDGTTAEGDLLEGFFVVSFCP